MTYPTTKYPTAKDTIDYIEVIDGATSIDSTLFGKISGAILAIENELGIKPSGIYSDTRQRLDAMELGLGIISSGVSPHSTTIATKFFHDWLSPTITAPSGPVVMPTVIGQLPMNPRVEAGFPDGYGYLYFMNRFFVDSDITTFQLSLWEVSSTPTLIVSQTFTPGEHTYSVLMSIPFANNDYLYELRLRQQSTVAIPTSTNSVMWNSRFLFIPIGSSSVAINPIKYMLIPFDSLDVLAGSKFIGSIPGPAVVQSVALIIDTAFDGGTTITAGDATITDRLMTAIQNMPAVIDTYRNDSDSEYTATTTSLNLYFTGTPTVGSGTAIVYFH